MLRRAYRFIWHPYRRRLVILIALLLLYLAFIAAKYLDWNVVFAFAHRPFLLNLAFWPFKLLKSPGTWKFLFFVGLIVALTTFWLFFFAQFVLPVTTLSDRRHVFSLLVKYILGTHGPAISMRDGEVIQRRSERLRSGKGVIVLDTASAAVLRTDLNFTRAVGPGLVFLSGAEKVDTALDLRVHSRSLGPRPGEDPFAPQGPDESDEAYEERQRRRWATSAKTRDGVEVVARVVVLFYLDDRPDDLSDDEYLRGRFHTDLHGHTVSAWRAALRRSLDMSPESGDTAPQLREWGWIPPHIAVDLWREYLQRFTLEELFRLEPRAGMGEDVNTALEVILAAMRERMTQPEYREMAADGSFTENILPSREYQVLQERGIRVRAAVVPDMFFPPAVEQQLIDRWVANWMVRALREREIVERRRRVAAKRGEETAISDLANLVVREACPESEALPTSQECAIRLIEQTVQLLKRSPELFLFDRGLVESLEEILSTLRGRG